MAVILKDQWEIELMHEAGKIAWACLQHIKKMVAPGVSAAKIDREVGIFVRDHKGYPTFKGYRGFPCNLCFSINEEVVHGIPSAKKVLREGDIVKLDVGVTYKGYVGDAAISVAVGNVDKKIEELIKTAESCLWASIDAMKPYGRLSDVSRAIQQCAESRGFYVVKSFVGHGVGTTMHEEPQIHNYVGHDYKDIILKPGIVLAPEPMVNMGTSDVVVLDDRWTVVTADGKPSAHFEHTIAITKDGKKILTLP
jgi:methionyl aminopeptidase